MTARWRPYLACATLLAATVHAGCKEQGPNPSATTVVVVTASTAVAPPPPIAPSRVFSANTPQPDIGDRSKNIEANFQLMSLNQLAYPDCPAFIAWVARQGKRDPWGNVI